MAAQQQEPAQAAPLLWYSKPATQWLEALPIGNGRLGGMLFGGIGTEHLQFNEQSLVTGTRQKVGNYQPFGDVFVTLDSAGPVRNYRRTLDLRNAVHTVQYEANGVRFRRTAFASYPDQVQVMQFTASKPGQLTGIVRLTDARQAPVRVEADKLVVTGTLENGMHYESQLQLVTKGGRVSVVPGGLRFTNATAVTIQLAAGTSFSNHAARDFIGPHPHERISSQLIRAARRSPEQLLARHTRDYQTLFGRVGLQLGTHSLAQAVALPDRMAAYARGKNDPALEALLFQFGRYLLISSSRPGGLPANLQGLWNQETKPAWYSQYTTNINVEMNYWLAEQTNLPECHQPLFDWVDNLARVQKHSPDPALKTSRGWIIYSTNNIMGGTSGWHIHRPGSAWLSQHFWEHFAFGGDRAFLRDKAYPLLKSITEYWADHLVARADGKLITPDGWSPEHGPHRQEKDVSEYAGASYDQQIVYDLFTNYLAAARELQLDTQHQRLIDSLRSRLLGPQVGRWGQLQEWMDDVDDPDDHHRHNSHLFAVYPGRQISPRSSPDLARAALVSLRARGDKNVGWSSAWKINLYARLREPAHAYTLIRQLVTPRDPARTGYYDAGGSYPNLFGVGPPFQIDSNFGYAAGVAELLLQSQTGDIDLLPALPPAWSEGQVSGLRARGGVTVAIDWKAGTLNQAKLTADRTGLYRIRYGNLVKPIQLMAGKPVWVNQRLQVNERFSGKRLQPSPRSNNQTTAKRPDSIP
ncbi:glycoside hydrolase family 95 protein [Spirosoma luteolum]